MVSPTSLVMLEQGCASAHFRSCGAVITVDLVPWGCPREVKRPVARTALYPLGEHHRRPLNFARCCTFVNRDTLQQKTEAERQFGCGLTAPSQHHPAGSDSFINHLDVGEPAESLQILGDVAEARGAMQAV